MKWVKLSKTTKKSLTYWLLTLMCVLGALDNKVYGAIYIEKYIDIFEWYISFLDKHYEKIINIPSEDINLPLLQKRAETIINNLSENEKKFLGILLVYPDKARQYHLSFKAKNLANKLIISKLFPNKIQLSEKEKQQIQKYASKIKENINTIELKKKLIILFSLQSIKQDLENKYFDVEYKQTKIWYLVKNIKPKLKKDFIIKITLPIKLANKENIINTEINKNLLLITDRSFWNRLNPNFHIYSKWTIIIITNPKNSDKLANLNLSYREQTNKQLEQTNKQLEQTNKFVKEYILTYFNWKELSIIWKYWYNINDYKKEWDKRYKFFTNNIEKVRKGINILKKRNLLENSIKSFKITAKLAIDKIKLESPRDAEEYKNKILEICKIILKESWKATDCKLDTNTNKNVNTARNSQ